MIDFLSLAKHRYSCRKYAETPLNRAILEEVLEAARIAPSAANTQPWLFVVITQDEMLRGIKACYARDWIATAPAVIVCCADHSRSWRRADGKDHADIDLAIAIDHITLAATAKGLGTCWVCKFDAMRCATLLGLPPHVSPVALIPIGYPADSANPHRHESQRRTLSQIVLWEKFG